MAERTMFGWWRVALILASSRDVELLAEIGIPEPVGSTRQWARSLLDGVEDFWEVYEVEPDGGAAARRLEVQLLEIAGAAAMPGLLDACEVFSRPLDDRINLDHWVMLLDEIWHDRELWIAPPTELPDRVRSVLADIGWPRSKRIRVRPPESITDDWEFGFWRNTEVDAEQVADEVLEARNTEWVLARLLETLSQEDSDALVAWANAEDDARQGPRPAIWPAKRPLALNSR